MQEKIEEKFYTIFLSSFLADDEWRQRLVGHFQPFRNTVAVWHEGLIAAGDSTVEERARALRMADLIILLLTPEYLSSPLYRDDEPRVIERLQKDGVPVVQIVCKACWWEETALTSLQSHAPVYVLPRTEEYVAKVAENEQDEALKLIVQEVYHLLDPRWVAPVRKQPTQGERESRESLLNLVHEIWIKDLLEGSLHEAVRVDLQLQNQPDALVDPWRYQVQELARKPYVLPVGTSMLEVYDGARGQLLILGRPGAGKTTLLLELTRDLLERAKRSVEQPMPVVFHLASWKPKFPSLAAWMVSELLSNKYQKIVKKAQAEKWIEQRQLIPLLDGLDEVPEPLRAGCMQAINVYQKEQEEHGASPLVVSCRSQEYKELAAHLDLIKAVRILPLTDEQIEAYLAQGQGRLDTLRTILHADQELWKLARQPLMLNIFTLTYRDSTAVDLPVYDSPEQLQHVIFTDYVRAMFKRRGELPPWMSSEQMQTWLMTIARNLRREGQTVFSIEDLQRDWLPKKQWWVYRLCTGLSFSLEAGVLGWLFGILFYGGNVQYFGLVVQLTAGLLFGLFGSLDATKIEVVDALTWSWRGQRKNRVSRLFVGLTIGLLFGMIAGSLVGIFGGELLGLFGGWLYRLFGGLSAGLIVGLGCGLGITLITVLSSGLSRKQFSQRAIFNEGIWRSGKNGLFFGIVAFLPAVLLFMQLLGQFGMLGLGLLLGPLLVVFGALFSGLFAFSQHFILRFCLWRTKVLPWNLVAFLKEATTRLFLRKAGGSYLFVHGLLLEYFASLETPLPIKKQDVILDEDK